MSRKDYIPGNDAQFIEWAENMVEIAAESCAEWGVIEPNEIIGNKIAVFKTKYANASNPNHGKIDTLEKNEARKDAEKALRSYVQGFLAKNPKITDIDRERMGITVYDTIPTTVATPTGQAEADITYPGRTQLQLRIKHIKGTPLDTKADYGYRVYYGVYAAGDEPPATGMDLHESKFTRQKKMLFSFMPTDSSKVAFFCIRYENSKGETGPWGPMFSAVIP